MARFADVQDLPPPPLFERMILVDPMPTAIALGVLGIIVFVALRRQGRDRVGGVGLLVGLALGAGVLGVGASVTTTREVLSASTAELVDLVAGGDAAGAGEWLGESLTFEASSRAVSRSRGWVLTQVEALGGFVAGNSRRSRGVEVRGESVGVGRVTVKTDLVQGGMVPSTWDVHWRRGSDGRWRVHRVECLSIFGSEPSPRIVEGSVP